MNNKFDTIIIGGGAAGMMAAISTKRNHPNQTVAIIDRTFALGRKILVCGAGRCNITNKNLEESINDSYYGASKSFINSIFDQFGYKEIVTFFNDLGVELYVERKTDIGKLFPITNQAKTITEMLLDEIARLEIKVFLNTEVIDIQTNSGFQIKTNEIEKSGKVINPNVLFQSEYLILSAGGKTYPALGSNGSGYNLAESLGHTMITPVPSALPLEAKSQLAHKLQGQKTDVEVTSIIEGTEVKTRVDEIIFTKYGFSGPVILNISREISIHFNRENKNDCKIKINFLPGYNSKTALKMLEERWEKRPDQTVTRSLYGLLPNKIAEVIVELSNNDPDILVSNLSEKQKSSLIESLTNNIVEITGTRGWNEAEFTAGGISASEITESTLESKKIPNLYICGEIIDVDGDVGGFNLSWSWASGFIAGKLS